MKNMILLSLLHVLISASLVGADEKKCVATSVEYLLQDSRRSTAFVETYSLKIKLLQRPLRHLIILPPTGGVSFIDRGYADYFCRHGFGVSILKDFTHSNLVNLFPYQLEMHDEVAKISIQAIRAILSRIPDDDPVYILGNSVGAILGSISFALEPRIRKGVFIVGGAYLPGIISQSRQKNLKDLKKIRKERFKFTDDISYEMLLKENIKIDPLYFLDSLGKKPGLYIYSVRDKFVPSKYQKKLYGPKKGHDDSVLKRSYLKHIPTILRTYYTRKSKIRAFFEND